MGNRLCLALCRALALLSFGSGGQKRLHDAAQLEILLQLQDGPRPERAPGAGRGKDLGLCWAAASRSCGHGSATRGPCADTADGTAALVLQAGTPSKPFLSFCHGSRDGLLASLRATKMKGVVPRLETRPRDRTPSPPPCDRPEIRSRPGLHLQTALGSHGRRFSPHPG